MNSEAVTLVVIPTYQERDNLEDIVARTRAAVPRADLLVVDDGSPDGTGELADKIAANDDAVHVLHRTAKNGLGAAYIAGFDWGLANGYAVLVEMDADGSHPPEALPELFGALDDGADLVIGSRWVPGGQTVNWPTSRRLISRGGSLYSRLALGIDVRDVTAGFRVFRAATLQAIDYRSVASRGYCFQVDLTRRTIAAGLRVVEVPITFTERERGESKMDSAIVREALVRVSMWGAQRRRDQLRGLVRARRDD